VPSNTVCKNGTVKIAISCNESPFPVGTDANISALFSYIGQVRDRLALRVLSDPRDRILPPTMLWRLKQCDVNRDFPIDSGLQMTLHDIQLKSGERVFRLYVKSLRDKAVYRVEESLSNDISLGDVAAGAIYKFSPQFAAFKEFREDVLKQLTQVTQELAQLKERMA